MLEVGRDRGQGLCVDGRSRHGRVQGTLGGDGEGGSGGGALMRGPRRPVRGEVVELRRGLRRFRDLDDGGRGRIWDTLVAISLVLPGFHETRRYHHRRCQLMGKGGGQAKESPSALGDKARSGSRQGTAGMRAANGRPRLPRTQRTGTMGAVVSDLHKDGEWGGGGREYTHFSRCRPGGYRSRLGGGWNAVEA